MSCCICCSYCLLFCSLSRSSYIFSVHLSVPMVVVTTASILLKCYHWFGWCTSIHRHHCHWNNLCVLCIVFCFCLFSMWRCVCLCCVVLLAVACYRLLALSTFGLHPLYNHFATNPICCDASCSSTVLHIRWRHIDRTLWDVRSDNGHVDNL